MSSFDLIFFLIVLLLGKDNEIDNLKSELSLKDKVIGKLQTEKEKLKQELQKFKGFWHSIMSHFHERICYDKDDNYKFDSMLKSIDDEYRTTLINFGKYKLVMFAMAKLMEMEITEQNQVALYLFNGINLL